MNTINCRIRQNEHHDVAGIAITPAEAVLLRQIHSPQEATFSKQALPADKHKFWKVIVNPVAVGEATVPKMNGSGEEIGRKPATNGDEVSRLRQKYNVRAKSGAHGSHIVDDLWPGMNPELPQTFEDIDLIVAPPAEAPKTVKRKKVEVVAAPVDEETGTAEQEAETGPGETGETGQTETAPEDPENSVAPPAAKPARAPRQPRKPRAARN